MQKTAFRPQQNGFAFINSWTFEPAEEQEMKRTLARSTDAAAAMASDRFGAMIDVVRPMLKEWVANAAPKNYGLCGGMAAAALDYFRSGQPTPRGKGIQDLPDNSTPEGAALRKYLTNRQLQTMAQNFPTLIGWMIMLHVDVPFVQSDGAAWLLARSKEEWAELKRHIDAGTPWPIMLVGSSASPFNNHQILAYGYDDPGGGTGTIFVYDMNCPDRENSITLDFRGAILQARETCADARRGPLRGFFCNVYEPANPPVVKY
ncbi:MAG: hypothetical protein RLZZ387_1748 [Chloroflexota bacterium]|jgi:hypothetical protein